MLKSSPWVAWHTPKHTLCGSYRSLGKGRHGYVGIDPTSKVATSQSYGECLGSSDSQHLAHALLFYVNHSLW